MKKSHHIIPALTAAAICLYVLCAFLFGYRISITLKAPFLTSAEYGEKYYDPGASAEVRNILLPFLHHSLKVSVSNHVNPSREDTYSVTYTASCRHQKETVERKVTVKDTKGPQIILTYNPDYYTLYNHPYEEEGYQAVDLKDGDVTSSVTSEIRGDWIYYTAEDSAGNTSTYIRAIPYDDRNGPVLTFSNGTVEEETIYVGNAWNTSVTANDDSDGDVTSSLKAEGNVDAGTIGDYPVTYTVTDSHGNTTTVIHTVHVRPLPVNKPAGEDRKTIYLTFDDGPGPYTAKLLDILDQYNVKATFFTTSSKPAYTSMIGEEYRRGHTVAIHTYTHAYSTIYASTDAYWNDFNAQNNIIAQQTGSTTAIFRFPGGSSNTVSKSYCPGIMTELTKEASAKGYTYFDWNVSSGDAGGTTDTDQVFENVKAGVEQCSAYGVPSVVLQHDIKDFSVNAVEKIIQWGLENGYHFSALSAGSHITHHGVNN